MASEFELLLVVVAAALIGITLVFLFFGEIGPRWWKDFMHRYQRWNFGAAAPIMQINPYRPITEALNENSDKFPPVKKRIKNAFLQRAIFYLVGIVIGIILVALASAFKW